ncbi:MAG: hypothetical protein KKD28_09655 [Chloroflexi bacterium]|nr:hypothetical protein [Chloroflexota bacterium]MBU1661724.1 hypothetical protein [Chloroflexota bacterium]
MKQSPQKFWLNPKFQVVTTWIWNGVGALIVTSIAMVILPVNIAINREAMSQRPGLTMLPIFAEIIAVGILPIIFTIISKDHITLYGISKKGLLKSIALSLLVVIAYYAYLFIKDGQFTTGISFANARINTPGNLLLAILALLAYGPLEIFFVVWLIHNTDRTFRKTNGVLSPGLVVTIVIYGLLHTFSQGTNALVIATLFLAFGVIYKYTRNSIGPMVAWTIINEFIWFLASALLSSA